MIRNVPTNLFSLHDLLVKNFFDSNGEYNSVVDTSGKSNIPVDVILTDSKLILEIACVGAEKEDIKIQQFPDSIRIKYEKPSQPENDKRYLVRTISRKSFDIGYKISGKYDLDNMEAVLEKGLLTVTIPLKGGELAREVLIN